MSGVFLSILIAWVSVARAAGPAECAATSAKICPGQDNDIVVYDCLEKSIGTLPTACREAVLKANPALGNELVIRTECAAEIPKVCPNKTNGLTLSSCLEDHYKSVGDPCLKKLMDQNSAFRADVEKARLEEKKKLETAAAEKKATVEVEEKQAELKQMAEVTEGRRKARMAECRKKLLKEFPDNSSLFPAEHPAISGFCTPYSKIPEPTAAQSACMTQLTQGLLPQHKAKSSQKFGAEADAWEVCQEGYADPAYFACAKKKLTLGEDILRAGNTCDEKYQRCEKDLTGGKYVTGKPAKEALYDLCTSFSSYYDTLDECAERQAPFWMHFYKQGRKGNLVVDQIADEKVKCVSFFEKAKPFVSCLSELWQKSPRLRNQAGSKMMVNLCRQSAAYRDCVLPRFFKLPDYIQAMGYPAYQREQQQIHDACTVKAALDKVDSTKTPAAKPCP